MRRSLGFGPAAPAAGPAESLAAHPPNPSSTSRTLGGRRGIVHRDSVAPRLYSSAMNLCWVGNRSQRIPQTLLHLSNLRWASRDRSSRLCRPLPYKVANA